jgi:hypothetical protein
VGVRGSGLQGALQVKVSSMGLEALDTLSRRHRGSFGIGGVISTHVHNASRVAELGQRTGRLKP